VSPASDEPIAERRRDPAGPPQRSALAIDGYEDPTRATANELIVTVFGFEAARSLWRVVSVRRRGATRNRIADAFM